MMHDRNTTAVSRIGLCGLAVMGQVCDPPRPNATTSPRASGGATRSLHGIRASVWRARPTPCALGLTSRAGSRGCQNLALNVAEKGFPISVFNRSSEKTDATVARAAKEGLGDKLTGYHDMKEFVASIQKPRAVIILVQAGAPVDMTIAKLCEFLEPGDVIVDGGNEWCVGVSLSSWLRNSQRNRHLYSSSSCPHIPTDAVRSLCSEDIRSCAAGASGTRTRSAAPRRWRRRASCTWAWA
jgi:hypothetical protein